MQNNFISKISPSVRFCVLLLIIFILFLAKSIYLILFTTVLTLILLIITGKKVNQYVNPLKRAFLPLLIFFVLYIIMFKEYNLLSIILFWYKSIFIIILINIFILSTNFRYLNEGLYGFFLPLKLLKINIEKFSLDMSLSIYFIKFFIESKEEIKYIQKNKGIIKYNIQNYLFPRIFYSINNLNLLQENLKTNLYKLNYKKADLKSKFIFILFFALFIMCIFKEVIL